MGDRNPNPARAPQAGAAAAPAAAAAPPPPSPPPAPPAAATFLPAAAPRPGARRIGEGDPYAAELEVWEALRRERAALPLPRAPPPPPPPPQPQAMGRAGGAGRAVFTADEWRARVAAHPLPREAAARLVMNFLVTEGHADAAAAFAAESGAPRGADAASIADRMAVRRALERDGDVAAAVERVNDIDPEILEDRPGLAFRLARQRFVELVRAGEHAAALEFARDELAPRGEDAPGLLAELERAAALLVFDAPEASPLGGLLGQAARARLAGELNAAILAAAAQEAEPRLPALLRLLAWSQAVLGELADFPRIDDAAAGVAVEPAGGGGGSGGGEEPMAE